MTRLQRAVHGFFISRGRGTVREIVITMCADDPEVLERVRLQHVILRVERFISELPFFYFLLFKLSLYLLEYALPPLSWKLTPFSWMPLERRLAYFDEWQSSGFYFKRVLLKMIQAVCVAHLYSERKLLEGLGYGPSIQHRLGAGMRARVAP